MPVQNGRARFDEGLEAVASGESIAQQSSAHWWDAELYRIEGDLISAGTAHSTEISGAELSALS